MQLNIFNTMTRQKELFIPSNPEMIKMYVCGPTVYDHPHIGNARAVVVYDVLFRVLRLLYGKNNINYVRNITDIDDKINQRAKELGITIQQLTKEITRYFHADMAYLNCLSPSIEPKATENISQMIDIITKLIELGHAYNINGEVFFSVKTYSEYTTLSGRNIDEMIAGARVEVDLNKKHPADFLLWKPASDKDDQSSIFDSPWGAGRPGWHIECSAMSHRYLGENFDIHGGGADLIFPHHTNEIAQSCCAFPNSNFAKYWIHNGFLTVNHEKMSKSLGNFITVRNLIDQSIPGEVIRYLLLATHYRKPLDYNDNALHNAKEYMNYLYRAIENVKTEVPPLDQDDKKENLSQEFLEALLNDLNTHEALVILHNIAKSINKESEPDLKQNLARKLIYSANFLGLLTQTPAIWFKANIDSNWVEEKIKAREEAKNIKDWQTADAIRVSLKEQGIILEDKPSGTTEWKKI